MSIGSIFQHCKQENVTNLNRQRRQAQELEYDRKPERAKSPKVVFENRRLPMTELFHKSEESGEEEDDDGMGDSSQEEDSSVEE